MRFQVELAFEGVVDRLDQLADRGQRRLAGATSYVVIGEWAAAQGRGVLDCLDGEPGGREVPCEATLRRCRQATDAPALVLRSSLRG